MDSDNSSENKSDTQEILSKPQKYTLYSVANLLASKLNINKKFLEPIFKKKGFKNVEITNEEMISKIELLISKNNINDFDVTKYNEQIQTKFTTLKENLGKLQILTLIKKLEAATDVNSILDILITAVNTTLENTIELDKLGEKQQFGGNINKIIKKYKINYQ